MLGRPPYKWTPEIEAEICTRLAEGESLAAICRDGHMPSISVVYRRILDDETFRADYSRAREDQADTDADRIGEIASQVAKGMMDPQAARVAIDAYKWTAGKRKPKVYGDKATTVHENPDGSALDLVTRIEIVPVTSNDNGED